VSRRPYWLTRLLPITAAVLAAVVVAALVVKARPGVPASRASQRPLPPVPVVAAVHRLQAQVDSPRLAEQARTVAPRERASFVRRGSPLPSGIMFDLRSLRYVDLDRHAYVATPTTAADIRATDAAGESYIVRLHRTPMGHWLLVETVPVGATTRAAPAATAKPVTASLMSQDMAAAASSCAVDLGTRVPVILVHGWKGSPADWGSSSDGGSMIHIIGNMPGVYVEPFDYHQVASSWVTNAAIGPALAKRIDCLARSSLRGGGLGKVILVDHSMGGLATRYAASQTVGGRQVSDELGLVVTIGTPNLGTAWANFADPLQAAVCNSAGTVGPFPSGSPCGDYSALQGLSKDSAQIDALPWLPSSVPLRAIAGDVTLSATLFNNTVTDDTSADLLVGVKSALAASQLPTPVDEGTGNRAFHCTIGVTHALDAPCWHVGLLSNPSVQLLVKQSIARYIAAAVRGTPAPAKVYLRTAPTQGIQAGFRLYTPPCAVAESCPLMLIPGSESGSSGLLALTGTQWSSWASTEATGTGTLIIGMTTTSISLPVRVTLSRPVRACGHFYWSTAEFTTLANSPPPAGHQDLFNGPLAIGNVNDQPCPV
jgi:hypothetical protein